MFPALSFASGTDPPGAVCISPEIVHACRMWHAVEEGGGEAMNKLQTVAALKEKGIDVTYEEGVIYLNGVRLEEARALLSDLGYHASFGIKGGPDADDKKKKKKGGLDEEDSDLV